MTYIPYIHPGPPVSAYVGYHGAPLYGERMVGNGRVGPSLRHIAWSRYLWGHGPTDAAAAALHAAALLLYTVLCCCCVCCCATLAADSAGILT